MRKRTENEAGENGIHDLFRLPPELAPTRFRAELCGGESVVVTGCSGVQLCDEEQIRLGVGQRSLLITGCGLYIDSMSSENVRVCGRIVALELI